MSEMPGDKIIMRTTTVGDGEGNAVKKWESSLELTDERLWTFIMNIVNECNRESPLRQYRYLGHFVTRENTIEPKTTGSSEPGIYFFEWCLVVVMEREV